MSHDSRRAFTLTELVVIVACCGILGVGAVLPPPNHLQPKSVRDSTQIVQIHRAFVIFAREMEGHLPRPGLINRKPDPQLGNIPGHGEEDHARNTTAALYSLVIAHNYFTPELVVSAIERNPKVEVDPDYNYEAYRPIDDSYWDATFVADLETGSNASYAHAVIDRDSTSWRATGDAREPVLGNRGPKDGRLDPDSYTCGPHGHWAGHLVFGDNRVRMLHFDLADRGNLIDDAGERQVHNVFILDDEERGGALITFTKRADDGDREFQFD